MSIQICSLEPAHFDGILLLGNTVHGDNYIDLAGIEDLYQRSWQNGLNASWVALDEKDKLVGFRLTIAADNWQPDQWCSPELWQIPAEKVCYFKCNTVDESTRGKGIGKELLLRSVASAKQQGAVAGLAHIWLASPNNSAYRYFSACGGELVKEHPNKWQIHSLQDNYMCPVCGSFCTCTAAEMLLRF